MTWRTIGGASLRVRTVGLCVSNVLQDVWQVEIMVEVNKELNKHG